jgi:hypothetical protein
MNQDDLSRRLRELEDREAIRALKARYFFACDGKDPAGLRACFADGPVAIDYGAVGKFANADALAAAFAAIACHEHMVELHHGSNPHIEVLDQAHARGRWTLHYQLIDTRARQLTQLAGFYEDEYRKQDGQWKISATRFTVTSTLVLALEESAVRTVFAGRRVPAPG